jgi:DnaJ-class molecular chaperone
MLSILTNNNHLYNFYELFEIINTASTKQIIKAYQNKIMNYNNTLSPDQINEIKIYKIGLYILMNTELRIIYDNILNNQMTQNVVSTINLEDTEINNLHASLNDQIKEENSLDSLFNIDNTWKDTNDDLGNKKTQNKTNIITNRIFSMAEFNKKPNFPSDFESELRRPLQGRVEKKQI